MITLIKDINLSRFWNIKTCSFSEILDCFKPIHFSSPKSKQQYFTTFMGQIFRILKNFIRKRAIEGLENLGKKFTDNVSECKVNVGI